MTPTVTNNAPVAAADSAYLQQMLDRVLNDSNGGSALRDIGSIGSQFDKFINSVFDRMDDIDPKAALQLLFAVQAGMAQAQPDAGVAPAPALAPTPAPAPAAPAEARADLDRLTRDLSNILRSASQPVPAWVSEASANVIKAAADGSLTPAEANTLKGLLSDAVKAAPAQQDSLKGVFDAYLDAATPDAPAGTTAPAPSMGDYSMRPTVMPPPNRILAAVMREVFNATSDGQLSGQELGSIRNMIGDVMRSAFGDGAADAFLNRLGQGSGVPVREPGWSTNMGPDNIPGFTRPVDRGYLTVDVLIGGSGSGGSLGGSPISGPGSTPNTGFVPRNVLGMDLDSGYIRYLAGMAQQSNFSPRTVEFLNKMMQQRGLSVDWLARTTGQDFATQFMAALNQMRAPMALEEQQVRHG